MSTLTVKLVNVTLVYAIHPGDDDLTSRLYQLYIKSTTGDDEKFIATLSVPEDPAAEVEPLVVLDMNEDKNEIYLLQTTTGDVIMKIVNVDTGEIQDMDMGVDSSLSSGLPLASTQALLLTHDPRILYVKNRELKIFDFKNGTTETLFTVADEKHITGTSLLRSGEMVICEVAQSPGLGSEVDPYLIHLDTAETELLFPEEGFISYNSDSFQWSPDDRYLWVEPYLEEVSQKKYYIYEVQSKTLEEVFVDVHVQDPALRDIDLLTWIERFNLF